MSAAASRCLVPIVVVVVADRTRASLSPRSWPLAVSRLRPLSALRSPRRPRSHLWRVRVLASRYADGMSGVRWTAGGNRGHPLLVRRPR